MLGGAWGHVVCGIAVFSMGSNRWLEAVALGDRQLIQNNDFNIPQHTSTFHRSDIPQEKHTP